MNKPLLSICIPTYNRENGLKDCLDHVVCQFKDNNIYRNVEIIISDNASEDGTGQIAKEYQDKYNNIFYFRNKENIGFDRNVYNALANARGYFCWTLNDDMILQLNAITYITDILKHDLDIGFFCIDQDLSFIEGKERMFQNGDEWLLRLGLTGGRLSQCIFKRDCIPQDMDKYFDNQWIHFSIAFEIMVSSKAFLIKNILSQRDVKECRWAKGGQALVVFIELKKMVENLIKIGYNPIIIGNILDEMSKGLLRQIVGAKIAGLKISWQKIRMVTEQFYKYPIKLSVSLIALVIPSFVFKALKKIKELVC